jgi:hypothetical protein
MNVDYVVEQFGGTVAMATLCEVTPSAVSNWKKEGAIPRAHIKFLRQRRPDLFEPAPGAASPLEQRQ